MTNGYPAAGKISRCGNIVSIQLNWIGPPAAPQPVVADACRAAAHSPGEPGKFPGGLVRLLIQLN
jgi:hypothetical protein